MAQSTGTETGTVTEYHYVMSMGWNVGGSGWGSSAQATFAGTYTPGPGDTEADAYLRIYDVTRKRLGTEGNVTVLFYRLTKNVALA